MKMRRVAGEVTVSFSAEMPADLGKLSVMCDDPAVEAVISAVGGDVDVFIWGEDKPPVSVYVEVFEDDVVIEEDDEVDE